MMSTHNNNQNSFGFNKSSGSCSKSNPNYGRPLAGSLTAMRAKNASVHVSREILQLCEIIDSEGQTNPHHPQLKMILFGQLFDIYNYISNKLVGLLLRARKHDLLVFEGEMLFQRRDDYVPIYMLRTLQEIKEIEKMFDEQVAKEKSTAGPAPLPTTVLMDRMQQQQHHQPQHNHY